MKKGPPRKLTPEIEKELCDEYLNTTSSVRSLLKKYNIGSTNFERIRKRNNLPLKHRSNTVAKIGKIKCNENYFENIDSENKAYWLGFITADGCIHQKQNGNLYKLSIQLSHIDFSHLEKFLIDLESEHTITVRDQLNKKLNKVYKGCFINICRPKLCEDLNKYGVGPNKSKELDPPLISDDLMPHYIRGLIDGDGCWTIDNSKYPQMHMSFVSSVESFTKDIKDILDAKCNVNKDIKIKTQIGCWSFTYGGNLQCGKIYQYLYNNATIYLDRKYNLCKQWFDNKFLEIEQ